MAQYAFNYNDIYDDYIVQAPPVTRPAAPRQENAETAQPELRRIGRTKQQVIKENQKKFKIALAKISIIMAAFISVIGMALISSTQVNAAQQRLDEVNLAYQASLEQNNALKLQLDNALAKVNIEKIAEKQLGMEKIPAKRKLSVNMSEFQ